MDKIHRSQFQLFLIQGVLLIVSLFSLSVHSAKTSQNEAFVVASEMTSQKSVSIQCDQLFLSKSFVDEKENLNHLSYTAGIIKDIYNLFPSYPELHFPARPLQPSEINQYFDKFWIHLDRIEKVIPSLPHQDGGIFTSVILFLRSSMKGIHESTSSFESTSSIHHRIQFISNMVKGFLFEALAVVFLRRHGFELIELGVSIHDLERETKQLLNHRENFVLNQLSFESQPASSSIDLLAVKNHMVYWVEMKSIKPIVPAEKQLFTEKTIDGMIQQVEERVELRSKLRLQGKVKIVSLIHFSLGEHVRQRLLNAGADEVIYIRKEYLDDVNSYPTLEWN